ncbi:MAG: VOC family protein, partial [Promethearchaeota archaeon]
DESIKFYKEILGLEFISREVDEEHGEEFAFFRTFGSNQALNERTQEGVIDQGHEFKLELLHRLEWKDEGSLKSSMNTATDRGEGPTKRFNLGFMYEANLPHLAFGINKERFKDLNEFVKYLETKKVSPKSGPFLIADEVEWVYYSDPDGNIIEFVNWLK